MLSDLQHPHLRLPQIRSQRLVADFLPVKFFRYFDCQLFPHRLKMTEN